MSRALPPYFLGRYPNKEVIWATYNSDLAKDFGREVRAIIRSEEVQNVFPGLALRQDSKAADRFHTEDGGGYYAVGFEGTLTGRGGDLLIVDDPFKDPKEALSATVRDSKWRWYTSVFETRAKRPGGELPPVRILMATRWHNDDIHGRIIANAKRGGEKVHVLQIPAICGEGTSREIALWEDYYPLKYLYERRAAMGEWMFSALYQQDPKANAGNIIKRADLQRARYKKPPALADMELFMTLDPALTPEAAEDADDPDFTEMAVWGQTEDNHLWALDWWYEQCEMDDWIRQLFVMFARWKPKVVLSEKGPIRRASEPIIMREGRDRGAPIPMHYVLADAKKEIRLMPFQAMTQAGMVHFPDNQWGDRMVEQLVEFPSAAHDDGVDNCSLIGLHRHRMFNPPPPPDRPDKPKKLDSSAIPVKEFMTKHKATGDVL